VIHPSPVLLGRRDLAGTYICLKHHALVITSSAATVRTEASLVDREQPGGFINTPFYSAIQQHYRTGADWVFCADLEQMTRHSVSINTQVQTPELD
jgi:hypothetical protein